MNFTMINDVSAGAIAVVPIIIAIVQAIKMVGLPHKFSPIVSIGVGILVAFIFGHEMRDITQNLLAGVIYGLSASGLYSGVKTTAHAKPATKEKE
jgi:uncharacterized membrane protein